jgi:hypothetical protein
MGRVWPGSIGGVRVKSRVRVCLGKVEVKHCARVYMETEEGLKRERNGGKSG